MLLRRENKLTLNKTQVELLDVVNQYKSKMHINALINTELGQPIAKVEDIYTLNNLYSLFIQSLENVK